MQEVSVDEVFSRVLALGNVTAIGVQNKTLKIQK
jgi:hypothetical protein